MSHHGTEVQKFVCPICYLTRQNSIVCGPCSNSRLEAIRNSVIENELINDLMRLQINAVFSAVYDETAFSKDALLLGLPGIPMPTSAAIGKLKVSIKKLDLRNLRSKQHRVERTLDSFHRKILALEAEINRQRLQNAELRESLELTKTKMAGLADAKLTELDKELFMIKHKTEFYINRQSSSIQLSRFQTIQESWLLGSSKNTPRLRYGRIIQLHEFATEKNQLNTVNTFLEDCIQLQLLLFEVFSIKDSQLELPYLDQLRKLLPDSNFYESVQSKINTLMLDDKGEDVTPPVDTSPNEQFNVPEHLDKIIIKNNVLQVPRSSRTMNLQRRSSVKQNEESEAKLNSHKDEDVPRETTSGAKLKAAKNDFTDTSAKPKRIVIVPHKILKKPFAKLEPNEYLKFVLVVVKILVDFNCLIAGVTDFYGRDSKSHMTRMSVNKFCYDFKGIFEQISKLQDLLKAAATEGDSGINEKQHSLLAYIDSLHSSTTTVDLEATAETTLQHSKLNFRAAQDGTLQKIYKRYILRHQQTNSQAQTKSRATGSKMDGIIYGLVSEAKMDKGPQPPKPKSQKRLQVQIGETSFDLKDIVSQVHAMISSGGGGHAAFSHGAHSQEFEVAMSMMERSKVHLDEWDMVSRMY